MKKIYTLLSAVLVSASLWAQAPQSFSYQAVVRGANNALVIGKVVGMKVSILQGSENGTIVYSESHSAKSNSNGLVTIAIGTGNVLSGVFTKIDWSNGIYFIKTETDPLGGTAYALSTVSQLLSVPYALYAGNALPNGGTHGQIITNCNGVPTWTTGGVCPGTITALNCSSATNNGTLTATTAASGVTSVISYTGGNGGTHNGQVVTSTGVTGLTATLQAGAFGNGNGSLTYTITGTPATSGTASFALNIGAKTCTVTRSVAIAPQNPTSGYGSNITDAEGNSYKTVYIGTQQWMGENLKTSKYSDGTTIPNITDNTQWQSNATGACAYYNNDAANNAKYGKLYNWYAVSGNKNVCPTGWHVPTDAEWTVLTDYLGGNSIAGGKLKEVGTTNWNSPNTESTNVSLFTGLPGGSRNDFGDYYGIGIYGYWWSSTEYIIEEHITEEYNTDNAWIRALGNSTGNASGGNVNKFYGFSVRCLRD
jgi:uncharacterized protein (TIGR02145 family)